MNCLSIPTASFLGGVLCQNNIKKGMFVSLGFYLSERSNEETRRWCIRMGNSGLHCVSKGPPVGGMGYRECSRALVLEFEVENGHRSTQVQFQNWFWHPGRLRCRMAGPDRDRVKTAFLNSDSKISNSGSTSKAFWQKLHSKANVGNNTGFDLCDHVSNVHWTSSSDSVLFDGDSL